jgi:hypothetical protein
MISTVFRGDDSPATMRAPPLGKARTSLKRASTALLALPRSGEAVTRTRSVSPSQPAIPLREEPGTTLTASLKLTERDVYLPELSIQTPLVPVLGRESDEYSQHHDRKFDSHGAPVSTAKSGA